MRMPRNLPKDAGSLADGSRLEISGQLLTQAYAAIWDAVTQLNVT